MRKSEEMGRSAEWRKKEYERIREKRRESGGEMEGEGNGDCGIHAKKNEGR